MHKQLGCIIKFWSSFCFCLTLVLKAPPAVYWKISFNGSIVNGLPRAWQNWCWFLFSKALIISVGDKRSVHSVRSSSIILGFFVGSFGTNSWFNYSWFFLFARQLFIFLSVSQSTWSVWQCFNSEIFFLFSIFPSILRSSIFCCICCDVSVSYSVWNFLNL